MDDIHSWHLSRLLDQAAQQHGDRPFLIGSRSLTYHEAACCTRRIAASLSRMGIGSADRVMIVAANRPETVLMAFAAARLGAIFTIISNAVRHYGLRQIVEQVQPAVVMLDHTGSTLVDELSEASIVWAGDTPCDERAVPFARLLDGPEIDGSCFPGIDLDPVCLIYTSGSTGVPRGIVISHDNIRFSASAIQERLRYRADDVIGLFLPLSFDYGLYQIFLALLTGASIFLGGPELVGPELLRKLAAYEISVLPGVPTLFAALLKLCDRSPQRLPSLRSVTNTGEHLPRAYIERLRQFFPEVQIFAMYGLTECKRISILLPHEVDTRRDSVGRPLTGTAAYVVDERGQPVPAGVVGELVVRGRHVALGYWRAREETRQRFRQTTATASRELYTGDLCRIDADGYIYVVGRNDDQCKHKGYRISLLEIEAVACAIEGVAQASAVQTKDPDQLHLFVTAAQHDITARRVFEVLRDRLESFKTPDKIHILDTLPENANGKVDRKQLQALLMNVDAV